MSLIEYIVIALLGLVIQPVFILGAMLFVDTSVWPALTPAAIPACRVLSAGR